MARTTRTKIICDSEYSVYQMDAVTALKTHGFLAKKVLPHLKNLNIKADVGSDLLMNIASEIANLADEECQKFFIEICEHAFKNGERVVFNNAFSCNLKEAYLVFLFVLEVNFSDFIKDVFGVEIKDLFKKAEAS